MSTTCVTSKGQVTIPKRIRKALGITLGSKVEFDLERGSARIRLVRTGTQSSIEAGPAILNYSGPRIPISEMQADTAMKKAAARARR
jgi:AbrB family looped-hinge helix DNA binding protein